MPKKRIAFFLIVILLTFGLILYLFPIKTLASHRRISNKSYSGTNTISIRASNKAIPTPTRTAIKIVLTATPTRAPIIPTTVPTVIIPTATHIPTSISQNTSVDNVKTYILNAINEYRSSNGLSKVSADSYTCAFAKIRAEEISRNFDHSGFRSRIDSKTLPYPSYSLITENIARNSDYKNVVQSWINSSGHAENMRKDTPYVCVEYYGNFYAYEGWKP